MQIAEDTLEMVFCFIDFRDIMSCMELVCKRWYEIATRDRLWQFLFKKHFPQKTVPTTSVYSALPRCF
jgi:hypothetical protein